MYLIGLVSADSLTTGWLIPPKLIVHLKRYRSSEKPKWEIRMENTTTLTTMSTKHRTKTKKQTAIQTTETMSNTDLIKYYEADE